MLICPIYAQSYRLPSVPAPLEARNQRQEARIGRAFTFVIIFEVWFCFLPSSVPAPPSSGQVIRLALASQELSYDARRKVCARPICCLRRKNNDASFFACTAVVFQFVCFARSLIAPVCALTGRCPDPAGFALHPPRALPLDPASPLAPGSSVRSGSRRSFVLR